MYMMYILNRAVIHGAHLINVDVSKCARLKEVTVVSLSILKNKG